MRQELGTEEIIWHPTPSFWLVLLLGGATLLAVFHHGLAEMVKMWNENKAYGYAYMIPFITAFLIWERRSWLEAQPLKGSWGALAVVFFGMVLYFFGHLSTITTILQYAFLVTLIGWAASLMGWKALRPIFVPLLLLAFMIPLPAFFYNNLSSQLQLLSSQLGVAFMRPFNISVYLSGNVIDLGAFKLQVVDACSGLRYLFPLASLAFIAAYIFKGRFWKKLIIFLSSLPITVLMNSFRVGMIGILVNYWGIGQAEGFRHWFEGWVIFMACIGILVVEMWVLSKIGKDRQPSLYHAFGLDFPKRVHSGRREPWRVPLPFWGSLVVVLSAVSLVALLGVQKQQTPERKSFADFPNVIGQWRGTRGGLATNFLNALKLTDYIVSQYTSPLGVVNFYSAYYKSQTAGDSAHSPRSCIPGAGWRIRSLTQRTLKGVYVGGQPLRVNRVIIQIGNDRRLVYYWLREQGRDVTNDYLAKWYIFWDALTLKRSDGALVRLVTPITEGDSIVQADARLTAFAKSIANVLPAYVPD